MRSIYHKKRLTILVRIRGPRSTALISNIMSIFRQRRLSRVHSSIRLAIEPQLCLIPIPNSICSTSRLVVASKSRHRPLCIQFSDLPKSTRKKYRLRLLWPIISSRIRLSRRSAQPGLRPLISCLCIISQFTQPQRSQTTTCCKQVRQVWIKLKVSEIQMH